ncbi:hypothetical protein LFJ64_002093 [Clostridium perfringens]|nr:hypothetical protein [Clostridium perfringens]EHR1331931.1 hypothetical protein [Clostridium perfringens]EHR1425408.1 hypothetical protein [Clostridium perfringens]EIF2086684.1 hypothetical protein [Clostridium perfringens]EIF6165325.1 hypothetical protein [Clostridium perfringens]
MPEGDIGKLIIEQFFPSDGWERDNKFTNLTAEIKSISEYTGLNFNEIYNLPYSLFLLYKKESWIYGLKQFEKGREFLKTLWELEQTETDKKAIEKYKAMRGGE